MKYAQPCRQCWWNNPFLKLNWCMKSLNLGFILCHNYKAIQQLWKFRKWWEEVWMGCSVINSGQKNWRGEISPTAKKTNWLNFASEITSSVPVSKTPLKYPSLDFSTKTQVWSPSFTCTIHSKGYHMSEHCYPEKKNYQNIEYKKEIKDLWEEGASRDPLHHFSKRIGSKFHSTWDTNPLN